MRIYFYHIERTGGTSITRMFVGGNKNYKKLIENKGKFIFKGKKYIGWTRHLIEKGDYYYAFSHIPKHRFELPENTFTFTILRDPVERVISYYKILMDIYESKELYRYERKEEYFIGDFEHFLNNITKKKLLKQLYMFSPTFNIEEAEKNIRSLNYYFTLENFDSGVKELSEKLKINLKPIKSNAGKIKVDTTPYLPRLKEMLKDEIELYNKLK